MQSPKNIFFIGMAVFLFFYTCQMIQRIPMNPSLDSFGPALFFSWYVSLCMTGVFAFSGFVFPTEKLLPTIYYKIKRPARLTKVYRILRADLFQKLLVFFFYGKPGNREAFFSGHKSGVAEFWDNTKKSEFGHLIPFILINVLAVYSFSLQKHYFGSGLILFNVFGNLYPVVIQRFHRLRLGKLMKRINRSE